ncbi:MAG TPA: hypothetical protein VMR70_01225 [Flavisolibacter sp.]|nr:hypothetical protein [Flavisolibacter sp.]
MAGSLRADIIQVIKAKFENDCISLLLESYRALVATNHNFQSFSENDITAQLVGHMKNNPKRQNLKISIKRENHLDSQETYAGNAKADESPRIDITYTVWSDKDEYEYHMEAKNLAENNWKKEGAKTKVDAGKLHKRYIATGIGNFLDGKYQNGCLLGYILQGSTKEVVAKINRLLEGGNRKKEVLVEQNSDAGSYYISRHSNTPAPLLKHFLLSFSN